MYTIAKLLQEYHSKQSNIKHLRVGQWFINEYGDRIDVLPWPKLFHEEDPTECIKIIDMWLRDNGYQHKSLPKKAKVKQEKSDEQ